MTPESWRNVKVGHYDIIINIIDNKRSYVVDKSVVGWADCGQIGVLVAGRHARTLRYP